MSHEKTPTQGGESTENNHLERAQELLAQLDGLGEKYEESDLQYRSLQGEPSEKALGETKGLLDERFNIALQIYQEWERAGKPGTGFFNNEKARKDALSLLMDFGPFKGNRTENIQERYSDTWSFPDFAVQLLLYCPDKVDELNKIVEIVKNTKKEEITHKRALNKWASITHPTGGPNQLFKEPEFSADLFQFEQK